MADSDIQPLGPRDRQMYEAEYKHAAGLFKQASEEYAKSDNMFQKAEFKKVMDQAMNVMQETVRELVRQDLQKQNDKIANDYANFQNNPNNQSLQQLEKDLDKAKKSV